MKKCDKTCYWSDRYGYCCKPEDKHCPLEVERVFGGWISVEDRLPENDRKRVLVLLDSTKLKKLIGEPEMDTDRFVDGRWVRWDGTITHWMPLPEPPKEGDGNG